MKHLAQAGDSQKTINRLIVFLGNEKLLFFFALFLLIGAAVLTAAAPGVLGNAITNHLERDMNLPAFFAQMILCLAFYGASFVISSAGSIIISIISNNVVFKIRQEGFRHIQRLSMSYFDTAGTGDIMSRLTNDLETIYYFISSGFNTFLNSIFSVIGIGIAMFILDIPMALAVLLILSPLVMVFIVQLGKVVREKARTHHGNIGKLSQVIEETIGGIKTITSFSREATEREKFSRVNRQASEAGTKLENSTYLMLGATQFLNGLSLVLTLTLGGVMVLLNLEVYSIGLVAAFMIYAKQFIDPFRMLSNVYTLFNAALAGSERIFEIFDSREELDLSDSRKKVNNIEGTVEFKGVSFGYDPDKKVLEDISFKTDGGEITAIVGPTGAGKTTLINLLSRFYDIQEGEILVDGINIKKYDLPSYRSNLGIVLQEPFFFAGTIKDNLLYGRPDATEADIIRASEQARSHHFISCLPEGYDTQLTERGMNISQGERQLLAITRTILQNPSIFILDEATSSVDTVTEKHIQLGIGELMKNRTGFIIAHRHSTIQNAHKVLVVKEGRCYFED